jgi:hypothetical protein
MSSQSVTDKRNTIKEFRIDAQRAIIEFTNFLQFVFVFQDFQTERIRDRRHHRHQQSHKEEEEEEKLPGGKFI